MLLFHLISVSFNVASHLLSQCIIHLTKLSNAKSVELIYFSLLLTLFIAQSLTRSLLHHCVLRTSAPALLPWIALWPIVRIYKNHGPNYSIKRYVLDCMQKVYCHRYAAMMAIVYFTIPKPHEIPSYSTGHIALHFLKSTMFLFDIIWCIFVAQIMSESTNEIKLHSIPCIAIKLILQSLISTMNSIHSHKSRNHVLQFIQLPASYEFTAHLMLYNISNCMVTATERVVLYTIIVHRVHFNHPLFLLLCQSINVLVGYHLVFSLVLSIVDGDCLGPIPMITKLAVSASTGHWVHFAVIGVHLFPRDFYVVHEIKMAAEVAVNGLLWLSIFATLNAPYLYRSMLTIPLTAITIALRLQHCHQTLRVNEWIAVDRGSYGGNQHKLTNHSTSSAALKRHCFYDRDTLCKLRIFEWTNMTRISLHRSSYPVLMGLMMEDMPLEVIRIMLEYADDLECGSGEVIHDKWVSAQANIDAIMPRFT